MTQSANGHPPPTLLDAREVRVTFGALVAVAGVSLQLHAGDLLGLIGPNGAGKTTLLRALAGLQPMAAGHARILGHAVGGPARDYARHLGFTPDTPAVYEGLTVRQYLEFIARGYGIHPSLWEERISFWLEKVWLADKAKQKVKSLSRGMRQRLGIARTLLPNPTVVLLDEPAAGLDPAGRVQFRELLVSLRQQGKALIVSSHILADMDEYCTLIGIMSAGRMVRLGTVHEVAHGVASHRRRYTLTLAGPADGAMTLLATLPGVSDVSVDTTGERVSLEADAEKAEAAALLAALVKAGLPVAGFAPNAIDLEEAYLRTGIRQVD